MRDVLDKAEGFGGMQKAIDFGVDSEKDAQQALVYGGEAEKPFAEGANPAEETKKLNPAFVEAMGQGRKKGQVNRLTRTMKEAIEKAFDNVGGPAYLEKMATGTATDRQAFMALIGRLLPMQVNSNIDQRIRVELPWLAARGIGKVQAIEAEALQHVGKGRTIDHAEQGGADESENA